MMDLARHGRVMCGVCGPGVEGDGVVVWWRSDFEFELRVMDVSGEREVALWGNDFWVEVVSEDGMRVVGCGVRDGVAVNCREVEGRVRVVCDGHGLTPGRLRGRLRVRLADAGFGDGWRDEGDCFDLGIELVDDGGRLRGGGVDVKRVVAGLPVMGFDGGVAELRERLAEVEERLRGGVAGSVTVTLQGSMGSEARLRVVDCGALGGEVDDEPWGYYYGVGIGDGGIGEWDCD